MADLTPTPDFPGIRIADGQQTGTPFADYVCRCGASDRATGTNDVTDLVADYTANHGPAHRRERGGR
ncbi:hypothetical protein AB0L49_31255 [Streptomyces antimycoticus]|uniref:hypothetical protein n=1 Tax=Streptomyces antimycoticus TaxID=68175 RepID=UPI003447A1C2